MTMQHRCDGVRQCLEGNDEWHCNITCPPDCTCIGLAFMCLSANLTVFPEQLSTEARRLDMTGNSLNMTLGMFDGFISLGVLILRENGIVEVPVGVFQPLVNLFMLDLRDNNLAILRSHTFAGLANLRFLKLLSQSCIV